MSVSRAQLYANFHTEIVSAPPEGPKQNKTAREASLQKISNTLGHSL